MRRPDKEVSRRHGMVSAAQVEDWFRTNFVEYAIECGYIVPVAVRRDGVAELRGTWAWAAPQ